MRAVEERIRDIAKNMDEVLVATHPEGGRSLAAEYITEAADEITRLRAERDELVEALMVIAAASRIEVQGVPRCEWCGSKAHTDDCPVGIARAVLEKVAP